MASSATSIRSSRLGGGAEKGPAHRWYLAGRPTLFPQPRTQPLPAHPDGQKFAIFYTKLHDRLLRPLLAADQPPAPTELRTALRTIDNHLSRRITQTRLPTAA